MKRQVASVDVNGRTIVTYVDQGKASALIGHRRPDGAKPVRVQAARAGA